MDRLPTSNGSLHVSNAKWLVKDRSIFWIIIALIGPVLPITVRSQSSCSVRLPEWTNIVPLPCDVAQIAHEPVLNELNDMGKLSSLISTRSGVHSSVMATNRELAQSLVCALKRHSCADSNERKARFALLNKVNSIGEQLKYTAVNVSQLYNLYSSIQSAYREYNLTIANALEGT